MRGWRALLWIGLASAGLLLSGFGPPRLIDREVAPTQRLSVGELQAWAAQTQLPDVTARAYVVYDLANDKVLMQQDSATQLAPASLTKLMTALLVFEHGRLADEVTVEARDLVGDATMGLVQGEVVTVTDLLWGMLVASGNDAAMALARHIGGDMNGFVAQMNTRAGKLGLRQTHFANPHGLDAPGHVSSAADLLTITRLLWEDPLFRAMVGTASITRAGHELRSTNEWLTTFPGATGVKTGTTDAAGECLIASVEREGSTVLLVLLGSRARYQDAEKLYAAAAAGYRRHAPDPRALSILNRIYGEGGVWFVDVTGEPPQVLVRQPGGPEVNGFRRVEVEPSHPLESGMRVGVLEWRLGDAVVGTQPLVVR
jgi:D-alanyl-D-alanine carboxypeptidase (penicillin-binding protein 5/6)